jgi:hypothetical protein
MAFVVHSARSAAHDFLEGEGAHAAVRERLAGAPHPIDVLTPLLRPTYHGLSELPAWLRAHRVDTWVIELPEAEGRLAENFDCLYPRLGMAVPHALVALRRAEQVGLDVKLRGIPLCALGPLATHALDSPPRAYGDACAGCALRARCPGVDARYLARFGGDELRSV